VAYLEEWDMSRLDAAAKRGMDLLLAGALTLAALPVMFVLALLVRLSSPGPVLFRQQRVGRDGESFQLYKFRTMRVANAGPSVTAGGDRRVTPVGRWLRKSKLDELPQLINVLAGDMSLVGPRPEVPEYVRHYDAEQRETLDVRPGITGLSQILLLGREEAMLAGRADAEQFYLTTIMPAKLSIDLRYVRERTFLGDLGLIVQTAVAIARHREVPAELPPGVAAPAKRAPQGR
jgi:lipopolysaccharide/colanic/teichoic acid biosynthesis glycosyltransferase